MPDARWLNAAEAAAYIGRRVDELPRLLKKGLLPKPSYHFGPRSPRYDRLALDALFTDDAPPRRSIEQAGAEAVADILRRAQEKRRH